MVAQLGRALGLGPRGSQVQVLSTRFFLDLMRRNCKSSPSEGSNFQINQIHKPCGRCKQIKNLLDFKFRNRTKQNRKSYCVSCERQYLREYYVVDSIKQIRRVQKNSERYRSRNKAMVLEHLRTHPCVDCGERDPIVLEFDHVFGAKLNNVSTMVYGSFRWHSIAAEIEKCEVRCANCHRKATIKRRDVLADGDLKRAPVAQLDRAAAF